MTLARQLRLLQTEGLWRLVEETKPAQDVAYRE
jgi:hypothetical protein